MSTGLQLGMGPQGPRGIPGAAGPAGAGGVVNVTNADGGTLLRGTAVAIHGYDVGTDSYAIDVASNLLQSHQAIGLLPADLAIGDSVALPVGDYTVTGIIGQPLDTSAAEVGDFAYLGENGAFVFTPPASGGVAFAQQLGVVATKDATVGAIQVLWMSPLPDQAGVAAAALKATTLTTTLPLRIGGGASANLSANSTLSINAATNAAAGAATAAQITALEAATAALAKIKSGSVTIASGASAGTVAMGAATWDGKPVTVTFHASAGNGKIGTNVPIARAVVASGTLTLTLLDKNGAEQNNNSSGAQTWFYIADGR